MKPCDFCKYKDEEKENGCKCPTSICAFIEWEEQWGRKVKKARKKAKRFKRKYLALRRAIYREEDKKDE